MIKFYEYLIKVTVVCNKNLKAHYHLAIEDEIRETERAMAVMEAVHIKMEHHVEDLKAKLVE